MAKNKYDEGYSKGTDAPPEQDQRDSAQWNGGPNGAKKSGINIEDNSTTGPAFDNRKPMGSKSNK